MNSVIIMIIISIEITGLTTIEPYIYTRLSLQKNFKYVTFGNLQIMQILLENLIIDACQLVDTIGNGNYGARCDVV